MEKIFLEAFNISFNAGLLIPVILIVRPILKNASKKLHFALWSIVGIRLIIPLNVIPSLEVITPSSLYDYSPTFDLGIEELNRLVNPVFSNIFASSPENSVNPLQIAVIISSWIWISGIIVMIIYGLITLIKSSKEKADFFQTLSFILLSIHWFNPLVWIAYFYCRKDLKKKENKT